MAEHSICQPGKPSPQRDGQRITWFLNRPVALNHKAKSAGFLFLASGALLLSPLLFYLPVFGRRRVFRKRGIFHVKIHRLVRFVGKALAFQNFMSSMNSGMCAVALEKNIRPDYVHLVYGRNKIIRVNSGQFPDGRAFFRAFSILSSPSSLSPVRWPTSVIFITCLTL